MYFCQISNMNSTSYKSHKIYNLSDIANHLKSVINKTYTGNYYIKAEIVKLNYYPRSGHAYPELVEKENGQIKVEMRAIIWQDDYLRISNDFFKITGEYLKDGMMILCLASIEFHEIHGLSLHIKNIDPSFSLGEMWRLKQLCIDKLQSKNLLYKNKKIKLAQLPQRLAIISIETSKGFNDFIECLKTVQHQYGFYYHLFRSILQGEKCVKEMLAQLHKIAENANFFDAVVILRGGGGDTGLDCYNNYDLCEAVANFPIPVICGIGHSTNETVVEMIAHTSKITPTEVAYFLIHLFEDFDNRITELTQKIENKSQFVLQEELQKLQIHKKSLKQSSLIILERHHHKINETLQQTQTISRFRIQENKQKMDIQNLKIKQITTSRIEYHTQEINRLKTLLQTHSKQLTTQHAQQLNYIEKNIKILDPINTLKRGFTLTYHQDSIITSSKNITHQKILKTVFYDGEIYSETINKPIL